MYYTVYKITNKVNGKFYIGCHKTADLNDSYMGSGELIKCAIKKYGVAKFEKEILFVYDNPDEMFAKETEIVDEGFVSDNNTYNLRVGGIGGFDHIRSNPSLMEKRNIAYRKYANSEQARISRLVALKKARIVSPFPSFKDKKHTQETKRKISEANKISQKGERNSNYGNVWCVRKNSTDYKERKLFSPSEIPEGWIPCKEKRESEKNKSNGAYGKKWYTDGVNSYLLKPDDPRISENRLRKGRLKFN